MHIVRPALDSIHEHLCSTYPHEGCGFLLGKPLENESVLVTHWQHVTNRRTADGHARNRYLIAPDDFMAAEESARRAGVELLGTYHSHPDAPSSPSDYDREHAWPWYRYLIVSVQHGSVGDQRVWKLADDRSRFTEHKLQIKEV